MQKRTHQNKIPTGNSRRSASRRDPHVRVRTARGRKISSTRWLERQLNDPYVKQAFADGYRSRSAYKLLELNDKYGFLTPGSIVLDLGSAPGGWSQVAAELVDSSNSSTSSVKGKVIAIDIQEMDQVPGVDFFQCNLLNIETLEGISDFFSLNRKLDVVISDMAAPSTGHAKTDHLRVIALCEKALHIAEIYLKLGGSLIIKVLDGGAAGDLQIRMKNAFTRVKTFKPSASRSDSSEKYVVALGFRSAPTIKDMIELQDR